MNPGNILTTITVVSVAYIFILIAEFFKEKEEEYDAPIGEPTLPPDERERERDREREYPTKALDANCSGDNQCSTSGKFGGPPSGPFDRIHCDRGRCEYDRKDYTGTFWYPPSKCVGDIFKGPGSCKISSEEDALREKLKREGRYERFSPR